MSEIKKELSPEDLNDCPYSEWLEEAVKQILEYQPRAICIQMVLKDDSTVAAYYNAGWVDKCIMQGSLQADITMDVVSANLPEIRERSEKFDEEEEEALAREADDDEDEVEYL